MPVRIVQSKQNARLKELRRALSRPRREPGELAGIEGPNLLEEAWRAGLRVPVVFLAEDGRELLAGMTVPPETDVLVVPRELLNDVLETETPQPVAALVEPPEWTWVHLLGNKGPLLLVVLAGIQDPGNLGTLVRSAEAFGACGMVSLPGTVSAWNQKALRASAGSAFRLPLISAGVEECLLQLREAEVKILTTVLRGGPAAESADLSGRVALVIGNEGKGVPENIAAEAGGRITIPCPGPVESLNAAVAGSVLLYEASRQRRAAAEFHKVTA